MHITKKEYLQVQNFSYVHSHVQVQIAFRDAFKKKKVNFGTLAQKGGGGQSKIPNVDQYWIWDI